MNNLTLILSILAILIIVALSALAIGLWMKVFKQRKVQAEQLAELEAQKQEKQDYILESVRVIAHNILHEDLNVSEGAIRLKMLLDNLFLPEQERQKFNAFDSLFDIVKDFDTHQGRKNLPKEERQRQDKIRLKHEALHRDDILKAAQLVMEYDFEASLKAS